MVRVKPIHVWKRNSVFGILRAFLEGKKNIKWVVGSIKSYAISIGEFDSIVAQLSGYQRFPLYPELSMIRSKVFFSV